MSRAWMPLYVADYLADTGHLSPAEHGAYLLLIMHYWQNGKLPIDDRKLARIARMSPAEWADARETVAEFFGADWTHKRIDEELATAAGISEKARDKANKRWQKQQDSSGNANADAGADAAAMPEHMPGQCQSQSQPPKGSEADASGAEAPAVLPEAKLTPRERLWIDGRPALLALGVPDRQAGNVMGRWLKDAGDDHDRVLGAILRARDMAPAAAIPWITAHLKQDAPHARKAKSVQDSARALEEWAKADAA